MTRVLCTTRTPERDTGQNRRTRCSGKNDGWFENDDSNRTERETLRRLKEGTET